MKVIGCVAFGVTIDDFQSELSMVDKFKILHDSSTTYELTNPKTLILSSWTWFKFSLINLRPRATSRSTLSHDDRIYIYLLTYHFRINFPKTIFSHLKYSIEISKTHLQSYIPYGRIMSEIIFREGIWEMEKRIGPEHSLVETICARMDTIEDLDDWNTGHLVHKESLSCYVN